MSGTLLSIENLNVSFGPLQKPIQAVRGVSLTAERGECVGLVGESGSGKSVTAWAAAGLLGVDSRVEGRVWLDGQALDERTPEELRRLRGTKVAMIFQEPSRSFDPIMNLERTFWETFRAHDSSVTLEQARTRAAALLNEVHISDAADRLGSFPHQFSGGMLQRVMIALALANNPDLLICDEPTTALDVTVQAQILAVLKELQSQRGLSLIFISHDLETVAQVADRIMIMYGGLVMEQGRTADVLKRPAHPYTQALWSSRVRRGTHYKTDRLSLIGGAPPDPQQPEPGCPFAPRCSRVHDSCKTAIPAWTETNGRAFRCLFPWEAP